MKKIIEKLKSDSFEYYLVKNNRLLFDFKSYLILLDFNLDTDKNNELGNFLDSSVGFSEIELPSSFTENIVVSRLSISAYQIGEDSIALKLFFFLKLIKEIDTTLVKNYCLDLNDDTASSSVEPNYIFQIKIDDKNINIYKLFEELINNQFSFLKTDVYYLPFMQKNKQLEGKKDIYILNSNTKIRRLGYLKILAQFFKTFPKVPLSKVNSRFEKYATKFNENLEYTKNSKGLIKITKTGVSAKPYLMLAKELGWLENVNRIQIQGKLMKVYIVLKDQLEEKDPNPFILSKLDKLFFLEILLRKDFFYLSSILELLFTSSEGMSYEELKSQFKDFLVNRLEEHRKGIEHTKNISSSRSLRQIKDRISNWEKPEVYLEHVLMPRFNWLLDLGIVNFNNKDQFIISLTESGKQLFKHMSFWMDINCSFIINPNIFLNQFYIHIFDSIFNIEKNKIFTPEVIKNKLNNELKDSFEYFKTLAPNRVNYSQAVLFVKYKLYYLHGIKIDQTTIEMYLKKEATNTYIYKFQEQYNDGYIQKIKP